MLTEKDYCDYETSRELKELGFVAGLGEGDCGYCLYDDSWHDQVDRPLLYEAQKWLREERGILLQPTYLELSDEWVCVIRDKNKRHGYSAQKQKHYEEALSEGIKEAIKHIEKYETL